ncbi:MAG: hypothetical protein KDD48_06250, partial [Bdellovibrionales bacterium]|nr:hypothetical protein [Bdellovibrionales bacterium]
MKILSLDIQKSDGQRVRFVPDPSRTLQTIRLGEDWSAESLVEVLGDLLFSDEFLLPNLSRAELIFTVFGKKFGIQKDYHAQKKTWNPIPPVPSQGATLENVLSGTIVKSPDILRHLLFFRFESWGGSSSTGESEQNQAKKRLEELRAQLQDYYRFEDLNQSFDEAQGQIFEVQERLKRFRDPLKMKKELKEKYKEYEVLDAIEFSPELIDALKSHQKMEDQYLENSYAIA